MVTPYIVDGETQSYRIFRLVTQVGRGTINPKRFVDEVGSGYQMGRRVHATLTLL